MSDDQTARFALPLLQPGQAQKEMFHNEALARIDLLVQPSVVAAGIDAPPGAPAEGECWIVGPAPTGAWAGHAAAIAGWSAGGWRFVAPVNGMTAWVVADSLHALFSGGDWAYGEVTGSVVRIAREQVVGARRPAIADPAGGSVTDAESRAAIVAVLGALRSHGLIEN